MPAGVTVTPSARAALGTTALQPATTCTILALTPSEASFMFAPLIPLSRSITTWTVPSRLGVTANAGELLAAVRTSASAVPTPAKPRVVPASTRGRARRRCCAAGPSPVPGQPRARARAHSRGDP